MGSCSGTTDINNIQLPPAHCHLLNVYEPLLLPLSSTNEDLLLQRRSVRPGVSDTGCAHQRAL